MTKAVFIRMPDTLDTVRAYTAEILSLGGDHAYAEYTVCSEIEMPQAEWDDFTTSFRENRDWIASFSKEHRPTADKAFACIRVSTPDSEIKLIIDPQGSSSAYFVGIEYPAFFKSDSPSEFYFESVDPPQDFSVAAKAAWLAHETFGLYKLKGRFVFTDDLFECINPTDEVFYSKYEFPTLKAFESWLLDRVAEWLRNCPEMVALWEKYLALK